MAQRHKFKTNAERQAAYRERQANVTETAMGGKLRAAVAACPHCTEQQLCGPHYKAWRKLAGALEAGGTLGGDRIVSGGYGAKKLDDVVAARARDFHGRAVHVKVNKGMRGEQSQIKAEADGDDKEPGTEGRYTGPQHDFRADAVERATHIYLKPLRDKAKEALPRLSTQFPNLTTDQRWDVAMEWAFEQLNGVTLEQHQRQMEEQN